MVQVDPEPGREVVLEEVAPAHLHDAVGGEPAAEHVEDPLGLDAGLGAEHERLAHGRDRDRDDDLVAGLDDLPRAVLADVDDRLAEHLEQRPGAVEVGLLPADHDRQRALARADVAAADRGVERADAALGRRLRDRDRHRGVDRAHVDEQVAAGRTGEDAVAPQDDVLDGR